MAEVEFNGSSGNIPDFALEDTQQKILTALKKQFKLDEKDIANAQKALRNDDKNAKAQLNALKDLGSDIRDAVDGKGTFFSSLSSGVSKTAGVLGTLGKVGGGLASGLIGLSSAVAVGVLNLTKGFGDDLKNAGLAESGAAFGSLGKELTTVVPGMMTLGLSVEQAAGAVNDFRGSMTATSGTAIQGVITEFQKLTNGGAAYGRTISENIEYLADEIEYRTRQGFITDRNAGRAAKQAQEMMDSQISASKLLGKSVDEIANGVKDLFSGDVDIAAALANLGPDVEQELRKTFQTFEGAGLPKEFQAGLAKMITDPIMLGSQEAKDAFNALSVLPDDMGGKVQSQIETLRAAMEMPEGADRTNAIAQANKDLEHSMLEMGSNISKLSQTEKEALFIQGNSIPFLKDLLSSQRGLAIAYENFNDKNKTELNKALENSVQFDNQITILKNSFGVILTSIKAGMAPALQSFTAALGDLSSEESPIGKFSIKLGEISKKIINKFNDLFGLAGDQEENTNMVTGLLETLGNYVAGAADSFISFVDSLLSNEGGSVMEKIGTYLSDIFVNLMGIVGEQLKNIDFMDLLFGESEQELTTDAAKRVESTKNRKRGNQSEEQQSAGLMRALSDVIEYRDDKNEKKAGSVDAEKMMEMVTKAGVNLQELTGEHLLKLFPDAEDLKDAIASTYGEGATEAFANVTGKIIEHTNAQSKNLEEGPRSYFRKDSQIDALQKEQMAIQDSFVDASLALIDADKKKQAEKLEEPKTLEEKQHEEILANAAKETGTPPSQQSSTSIITDPETAKPTAPGPTSQDGTSTQAVKPAVPMADASNQENAMKSTEDLISILLTKTDTTNKILKSIAGSSSSTASNTG